MHEGGKEGDMIQQNEKATKCATAKEREGKEMEGERERGRREVFREV